MARPQIGRITPFDADNDYEISISWTGNRAHANRIVIYDNETNTPVFDDLVSSFELKHTIPAHTLTNGKRWTMEAQVYDKENIPSALSEKVLFYTFTTPDFYFDNIPEDGRITSGSFNVSLHYFSPEWEKLSSYHFYLYDTTKKVLMESSTFNDDTDIHYMYKGLDNNTEYYIRCMGVTVNGMPLDTGYIRISVWYENPNTYARIYTTALPSQGCIQVASNLIVIQHNGADDFTYEDSMIDLRDKTLCYDEGFLIEDDFTLLLRGKYLWQDAELLAMRGKDMALTLSSRIYTNGKLRFRLLVPNGVSNYLLYSDELEFDDQDTVTIAIRRSNNVYLLKAYIDDESSGGE